MTKVQPEVQLGLEELEAEVEERPKLRIILKKSDTTIKFNVQVEEQHIEQRFQQMAREQQEPSNCFLYLYLYLYLYQAVSREAVQPAAGPNWLEDGGNPTPVLDQTLVQAEVQQKPVSLVVGAVKQHTALLNVLANGYKQEQVEARQARRLEEVWEVRQHPIEPSERGVESCDIQGSPKPSGPVHYVVPQSEHVPESSEMLDP